ncbi:PilZ domain-containing protein [Pseudomonas massiliensis]|uniref:PilZ domain-containing protein n=1 Tax=Pseudomonas massiliensis TaxID=522492 RepID=UPI00058DFB76|nr:PilZ domain-containing protein [Pseudomonas massiliensis]
MGQLDQQYSEKRDFIRMTVDAEVTATAHGERIQAVCHDLSGNGIQLRARCQWQLGDRVQVHLPSHSKDLADYDAMTEVVRVEDLPNGERILGLSVIKH